LLLAVRSSSRAAVTGVGVEQPRSARLATGDVDPAFVGRYSGDGLIEEDVYPTNT